MRRGGLATLGQGRWDKEKKEEEEEKKAAEDVPATSSSSMEAPQFQFIDRVLGIPVARRDR